MTGMKFGLTLMAIIVMACAVLFPSPGDMTNGHLGLLMPNRGLFHSSCGWRL